MLRGGGSIKLSFGQHIPHVRIDEERFISILPGLLPGLGKFISTVFNCPTSAYFAGQSSKAHAAGSPTSILLLKTNQSKFLITS